MKVSYTAKSYSGEAKGGEMDVKNERDLAGILRAEGFVLTSFKILEEEKKKTIEAKFFDRFFGISLKEKLMFTRNLGVMVSSGLPLSKAILSIALQTKDKRFVKVLKDIQSEVQSGANFADGLAKYPAIFNDLFVNMVKVGESSGNLEEVLNILALQLEKEHDLRSKVRGAMMYPAVIIVAMIGIGILMLTYILPKITGVFQDMNVTLPPSTMFIIAISDFLRNHSVMAVGLVVFLGVFFKFFLKTEAGKKTAAFVVINTPVVNNIVIKVNCARFARIYSSLLKSGVSLVETLKIISETLTNYYYKNAAIEGIEYVQKGNNLSVLIAGKKKIFPVLVSQMLEVGEETGKTEVVLLKLAEFYEAEVDQLTKNLSSIIEPVLMVIIGGAVGFFAISMLQPMYSIMDNIK
jgi:type IV pilus assembly protein PilC